MTEEQLQLLINYIREITLARICSDGGRYYSADQHFGVADGIVEELFATCKKQEELCANSSK